MPCVCVEKEMPKGERMCPETASTNRLSFSSFPPANTYLQPETDVFRLEDV